MIREWESFQEYKVTESVYFQWPWTITPRDAKICKATTKTQQKAKATQHNSPETAIHITGFACKLYVCVCYICTEVDRDVILDTLPVYLLRERSSRKRISLKTLSHSGQCGSFAAILSWIDALHLMQATTENEETKSIMLTYWYVKDHFHATRKTLAQASRTEQGRVILWEYVATTGAANFRTQSFLLIYIQWPHVACILDKHIFSVYGYVTSINLRTLLQYSQFHLRLNV